MKFNKGIILNVIRDRWNFYLIGYVFGYAFPLIYEGIPNNLYLIPVKLSGLVFALGLGTPLYYSSQKIPVFESAYRLIKYGLLILAITVLFYILQQVFLVFKIDITPFLGFPKPA